MALLALQDSFAWRRPATVRGRICQVVAYYAALGVAMGLFAGWEVGLRGQSPLVHPILMLLSLYVVSRLRPPFPPLSLEESRKWGLKVLVFFLLFIGAKMVPMPDAPGLIVIGFFFIVGIASMVRDCRRVSAPAFVFEPPAPRKTMDLTNALKFRAEEW